MIGSAIPGFIWRRGRMQIIFSEYIENERVVWFNNPDAEIQSVKTIPLEPLASKILCERIEPDKRSRGGVIIPDNAKQPSTMKARVLSIGSGVNEDNGRRRIEVGDVLTFAQFAGTEIEFGGEKCLALHVDDVLAVIAERRHVITGDHRF